MREMAAALPAWAWLAALSVAALSIALLSVIARLRALHRRLEESRRRQEALSRENAGLEERLRAREADVENLRRDRITPLEEESDALRRELADLRGRLETTARENAELSARLEAERRGHQEKVRLLEEAEQRLAREFENLANRIFEEKGQKFSEQNRATLQTVLDPLRSQIQEFRQKVEAVHDRGMRDHTSLQLEIHRLRELNERLSQDALNLTNALKGESKVRGNWGELQLQRILEESGLTQGREYELQGSYRDEEGNRLMPDVVIHLPEKKDVVIDSKVSLAAWDRYHAAESAEERERALQEHVQSLRRHIRELSEKNYDQLLQLNSLDLVLMFVPIEPALLAALESVPELYNEAFARGILLVSPTTLLGTLQIIHNIWRHEYQNRNAREIARLAGELHDAFVRFVDSLDEVDRHIGKAAEAAGQARKRLVSGRGNLVGRVVRLKKLGARTRKELPEELLERAGVEEALPAPEEGEESLADEEPWPEEPPR